MWLDWQSFQYMCVYRGHVYIAEAIMYLREMNNVQ